MDWLKKLGKDIRGSRPRCVLLTDGGPEQVAERLTEIVGRPEVLVSSDDRWQPKGKADPCEAQLDKCAALLPDATLRKQLKDWWLAKSARTPNWDIASTCTVSGDKGLLLVEAKAHAGELLEQDRCQAKDPNLQQIKCALAQASASLRQISGGQWKLTTRSHYQLSNRFSWSWKLASLGIPVVLIYLGFLNAREMRDAGEPFHSGDDWRNKVLSHCGGTVDKCCWNKRLNVGETPFLPLLRVVEQPLEMRTLPPTPPG